MYPSLWAGGVNALATNDDKLDDEFLQAILEEVETSLYIGNLSKAADLLERSKKQFEDARPLIYANYLLKLGWVYIRRRRMAEAISEFEEATKIIEDRPKGNPEWDKLRQDKFWGESRIEKIKGNFTKSEEILEKALLQRKAKDEITARVLIDLAIILVEKGNFKKGLDNYLKGIWILEKTDDKKELARAYNNISDAYIKNAEWENAIEFADKCIELCRKLGNKRIEGFGSMNGAEASLKMDKLEQAREYLVSCKKVWQNSQESYDLGCMYYIEGMVETADSNFDKAIEAFAKSLDLLEDSDHKFQVGRIYHEYGKMYLKKGDRETAKENLKEAVRILDEYNIIDELKAVYDTLESLDS
jgi:tetratricopeptide (TPR) repeat protein